MKLSQALLPVLRDPLGRLDLSVAAVALWLWQPQQTGPGVPWGRRQASKRCRGRAWRCWKSEHNGMWMGEIWYFNGMLDIVKWDMNEIQWDLFGY